MEEFEEPDILTEEDELLLDEIWELYDELPEDGFEEDDQDEIY